MRSPLAHQIVHSNRQVQWYRHDRLPPRRRFVIAEIPLAARLVFRPLASNTFGMAELSARTSATARGAQFGQRWTPRARIIAAPIPLP